MTGAQPPHPRYEIGWYNGWSPDERRQATPVQKAAVKSGALPYPSRCSICGVRGYRGSDNPVWFHDEDYADPLAAYHVCRRCHVTLHRRFEQPEPWLALVQQHGDGTRWFELLTMDPASLQQPFEQTYPNGLPRATSGQADHHESPEGVSPS